MSNDLGMISFAEGTYSNTTTSNCDSIDLIKMMKILKATQDRLSDPWQDFAVENGFSLWDGDLLLVPEGTIEAVFHGAIVPKGLKESKFIEPGTVYFVKNAFPKPTMARMPTLALTKSYKYVTR